MANKNNEFYKIEQIYNSANFHEDDIIIKILEEHKSVENALAIKNKNNIQFHRFNADAINDLIENIDNSSDKCDAIIYLYPFLIVRYMTAQSNPNKPSAANAKHREYFNKWKSIYENKYNIDIDYIYNELIRLFSNYIFGGYNQDLINYITKVNDTNFRFIYQFCRVLLYDEKFCYSLFSYEGTTHRGSYILFDIIINKIVNWNERIYWIDKSIAFYEKYLNNNLNTLPEYYLLYTKLNKFTFLSYDKNNINDNFFNDFDLISLPKFEKGENLYLLYRLYNQKLLVLINVNKQEDILKICNYLLDILNNSNEHSLTELFIIERLNWLKSSTLTSSGMKQEHIDWFFKIISTASLENIKGKIFLSPFIEQGEIEKSLYHFTDLNAMKSIIENGNLWLTRFDFLNDTEEIKYTLKVIENGLINIKNINNELAEFIELCLNIINFYFDENFDKPIDKNDELIASLIKDSLANIYVLSTSERNDNLSLWHYYSEGTGCSIKINSKDLKTQVAAYNSEIGNQFAPIFMKEINYTNDISKTKLFSTLETIFNNNSLSEEHQKFIACVHIIYEGIFVKNPNIVQEEEFRIAVIAPAFHKDNQVVTKFRVSKNTFIPYIELKINPVASIQEICIAPLNKTDIAKKGLEEFLQNKGFQNASEMVKVSAIKLRY